MDQTIVSKGKKLNNSDREKLWKNYLSTHDMYFRNQIIEEYAYLVKDVEKSTLYFGSNVEHEDLQSYGIIGLIDAIDKFDINANVKFETYASPRIRGEILDNVRKLDWIPRLLRERQKKIQDAVSACRERGIIYPSDKEIANELGVDVATYLDWETQLLGTNVFSIESSIDDDEDDSAGTISVIEQSTYITPEEYIDKEDLKNAIAESIAKLSEQEQRVILLIYYEDLSAREASVVLGRSEGRVSQIHKQALGKMKETISKYIDLPIPA